MKKLYFALFFLPFFSFAQFGENQELFRPKWDQLEDIKMLTADINSDGLLDLLYLNRIESDYALYCRFGENGSTFSQTETLLYDLGGYIQFEQEDLVDIDQDGLLELIYANQDMDIQWLNFDADGQILSDELIYENPGLNYYGCSANYDCFELGDVDLDGDLDIITSYQSPGYTEYTTDYSYEEIDTYVIWLEDPASTNTEHPLYYFYSYTSSQSSPPDFTTNWYHINIREVSLSNVDGDGDMDLHMLIEWNGGTSGSMGEFYGSGEEIKLVRGTNVGQFSNLFIDDLETSYLQNDPFGDAQVAFVDLDLDGIVEGVINEGFSTEIQQNPHDNLGQQMAFFDQLRHFEVVDFDQDGMPDIVGEDLNQIKFFKNNGNFNFEEIVIWDKAPHLDLGDYSFGDANGNGFIDLIALYPDQGELFVLEQNNGQFQKTILVEPLIYNPVESKSGDLNGDGLSDYTLRGSDNKLLWLGVNDNPLVVDTQYINVDTLVVEDHFLLDLNNNNTLDVILNTAYGLFLNENDGSGNFSNPIQISSTQLNGIVELQTTDFDGDGDQDLLLLSQYSPGIRWLENDNLFFQNEYSIENEASHSSRTLVEDFDNNGLLDFVHYHWNTDSIKIIFTNGNGTFTETGFNQFLNVYGIESLDYNFDGYADFAVRNSNDLVVYLNQQNQTFDPPIILVEDFNSNSFYFDDIDNDLDLDIVGSNLYINVGNYVFAEPLNIDGLPSSNLQLSTGIDLNQDSHDDLLWFRFGRLYFKLFEGDDLKSISGRVYWDENENGQWDNGEPPFPFAPLYFSPDNFTQYITSFGNYIRFYDQSGLHDISPLFNPLVWELTTSPDVYNIELNAGNPMETGVDFGFKIGAEGTEIVEGNVHVQNWLCGGTGFSNIAAFNAGNTTPSGRMEYCLHDAIGILAANGSDSISGSTIHYSFENIAFNTSVQYGVAMQFPGVDFIDSTLTYTLKIFNENDSLIEWVEIDEVVTCAYDPNDITEHTGWTDQGYVLGNEALEYTIRFQNTGSDTAHTVVIDNPIPPQLMRNSLTMVNASHPYDLVIDENDKAIFTFPEIFLPDSNVNEPESHGFVSFRINMEPNLPIGTTIENTAYIYFDFNPAIVTNTELNTLFSCDGLANISSAQSLCEGEVLNAQSDSILIENFDWTLNNEIISSSNSTNYLLNETGDLWLKLTVNNPVCSSSDSLLISVAETPIANAGEDISACGLSTELNAIFSQDSTFWTIPIDLEINSPQDPNGIISSNTFGTYYLLWNVSNQICASSDSVQVSFFEPANASAGMDTTFCALEGILQADDSPFDGYWEGPIEVSFSDTSSTSALIVSDEFGQFELTWTVSNGSCTASDTLLISFLETPFSNAGLDSEFCGFEGLVMAEENGFEGFWSGPSSITFNSPLENESGIISDGQGSHILTWTSLNGLCSSSDSIEVYFYEIPWVEIAQVDEVLYANTFGNNYQWYLDGDSIPGANGESFTPLQNGTYTVSVEGQNECLGFSEPFNFIVDRIDEHDDFQFIISPNPFQDFAWIEIQNSNISDLILELISPEGKLIRTKHLTANIFKLEREHLPAGMYLLNLKTRNGQLLKTEKLILE